MAIARSPDYNPGVRGPYTTESLRIARALDEMDGRLFGVVFGAIALLKEVNSAPPDAPTSIRGDTTVAETALGAPVGVVSSTSFTMTPES